MEKICAKSEVTDMSEIIIRKCAKCKGEIEIEKNEDRITIRITGEGFLYNMVRIIAGTLMDIGGGLYPPEKMQEILEAKDRKKAGPTAPARGLTLMEIQYF